MAAKQKADPVQWYVDHDAPNYYPENMVYRDAVVSSDWDLIATQREIDSAHPAVVNYDPEKAGTVDLVQTGGETYINEGHHRLTGAFAAGKSQKARVWFDPEEK